MFKSVFTKYISVFVLIIVISFMLLTLILCNTVEDYSTDAKAESIERTSLVVAGAVAELYSHNNVSDFNRFMYFNLEDMQSLISALSEYNGDINIFITDENGALLVHDDSDKKDTVKSNVPIDMMARLKTEKAISHVGTLDGVFEKRHITHIHGIYDNNGALIGSAVSYSESGQIATLIETMVKTIVLSCLWIMLATLVAVYFISEKIIHPLKDMSKAAKSFAAGKFDVRVPVKGRDEVAELATAFNNMAASMAKLEDMRRTFLSSVSHDLRTPMTTISGFIDGIIDGTIPEDKHEYYLDIIRTEVRRLARLVSSLLDITRIQAGERKFNKSVFDICEMARLILISFEQKIDEKRLDVEFNCKEDKMMVYADRDAIYQILYNICDNGVKFSKEGGAYRISITEREHRVYISVYNEGIGIPAEELPFVFERFYKSDKSRGLDKTGVGLGLYIAKTIIDAHDEEIWVKSTHGENCEFVFTLPHTPEAEIVVKD